jgi:hypothetical protein
MLTERGVVLHWLNLCATKYTFMLLTKPVLANTRTKPVRMLTERGLVLPVEGSESEETVFRSVQQVFLQQLPLLPAD